MEFKTSALGVLLAACLCVLPSGTQEKKKSESLKPPPKDLPLIRTDLLVIEEGDIPEPLRNPFRPRVAPKANVVEKAPAVKTPPAEPPSEEPPPFPLNLTYLGSAQTGGKTTALILLNGQALPIAEGEEVVPGYKIVRITTEEVEVEGPDMQKKIFTRRGGMP